jgi:hypothetical protein
MEPATAEWRVRDASKPVVAYDSPNPGRSILEFSVSAPASGEISIHVILEPNP